MSSPQPAVQPRTMSAPSDSGRRSAGGGDSVRSNNAGSGREGRSRR
jgi:hypothetical protein